jgi:outer membrane receptor protein involved in Fe transport
LLGRQPDATAYAADAGGLVTAVSAGEVIALRLTPEILNFKVSQELYSAELQQVFEQANHTTVLGALYQHTDFHLRDVEKTSSGDYFPLPGITGYGTMASVNVHPDFERISAYAYHSWQILDPLLLVGGLSYDRIFFPLNWNSPPVADTQATKDQISPKAGLIWTPAKNTTVRAAYTRSLSGTSLDQSFRIEPTQVAGINQAYRSLISESLEGGTSGARFETYGLSLEQKFETGTYIGLTGELLYSDVNRNKGTYFFDVDSPSYAYLTDFTLREHLHSRERSVVLTVDQLLDKEWSVGARYRLTQAELDDDLVDVGEIDPLFLDYPMQARRHYESLLHQLNLHANFNHASGFFSSFEAVWYLQNNSAFIANQSADDFWQFNLLGGYRFCHRRARIETGVLNLSDQDYRLSPLTWHNDLPRERTFVARFQFSF